MSRKRRGPTPVCPQCFDTAHHQALRHPSLWWCDTCHQFFTEVTDADIAKSAAYQMALDGTNDLTYED